MSNLTPKKALFKLLDLVYFRSESTKAWSQEEDEETRKAPITLQISGPEDARLVVFVGENASGKSFIRRILHAFHAQDKVEFISISAEGRRNVSYNIGLVFVYGDEQHDSSGVNSSVTITSAMATSASREKSHAIFWDEPDLGLSEGWSECAGREIASFMKKPPKHLNGVYIVTHSKALVRGLRGLNPIFVYVGETPRTHSIDDWLNAPPVRYDSLKDLQEAGRKRFQALQKLIPKKA